MSTREKLYRWIVEFSSLWGKPPYTVPITKVEVLDIVKEEPMQMIPIMDAAPRLFGIECEESEFAEGIRVKRLEIPITQYVREWHVNEALKSGLEFLEQEQFRILKLHVLSNHTRLSVSLEWDPWSWWKRTLHLTKWFPVKTFVRDIDATVIYPFCKVIIPHNKHRVHFSIHERP